MFCILQTVFSTSIFHFQLSILKKLRSGIICFFTLQTVFPTLIFHFPFSILHLIKTVCTNGVRRHAVRASNERPYGIVRTITILRSGIICFFTLQTVFPTLIFHFPFSILHLIKTVCTNWVRRLAVRASNERPYGIVRMVAMLRSGIICSFTLQTVFPTLIFHFPFSILHLIKTVCTNGERRHAVTPSRRHAVTPCNSRLLVKNHALHYNIRKR